jgi:hypothetical protein
MIDDRKQIERIQQEMKQLSQKQHELVKDHNQKTKSYEQQKTLYQRIFGQPILQPDPELQSINSRIEDLKEQRRDYMKVIQAAASVPPPVPEKDWSKTPLYSKRLTKFGLITPADQINGYTSFVGGIIGLVYAGSNFYRAHHLFKLTHCMEKTEEWTYHWARARATPQQIELASYWIGRFKLRGYAALGAPLLFVVYMWSKRMKQ